MFWKTSWIEYSNMVKTLTIEDSTLNSAAKATNQQAAYNQLSLFDHLVYFQPILNEDGLFGSVSTWFRPGHFRGTERIIGKIGKTV